MNLPARNAAVTFTIYQHEATSLVAILIAIGFPLLSPAQTPLPNEGHGIGTISSNSPLHVWSVSAAAGNSIVARVYKDGPSGGFSPQFSIHDPSGVQLGPAQDGSPIGERVAVATTNGVFSVHVHATSPANFPTGSYGIAVAVAGSPFNIPPGDEGGPMTNGFTYTGYLQFDDMDMWTFPASNGDYIYVRMGADTLATQPSLRLYNPAGTQIDGISGDYSAEVAVTAANIGTYTVIASPSISAFAPFSGPYRLTLAKARAVIATAPNDEGGPLTNGVAVQGTILPGDLDTWSFTTLTSNTLTFNFTVLSGSNGFAPQLSMLYPDGTLDNFPFPARTPKSGTYIVVVRDNSNISPESGTYQLTVLGFTGPPIITNAFISGTNFFFAGGGGGPRASYVILASADIALPLPSWTPVRTNFFDNLGNFGVTNTFTFLQRFFTLSVP
jgi:hypothetical protein